MKPQLSIIVAIYQVENYLENCLESLAKQSFEAVEILLINDGSTDKSAIICNEYVQKDKRFRLIHRTNGGLSAARNTGIEQAQGEYITFVDGDDAIAKDTYRLNMSILTADRDIDLLEFPAEIYYQSKEQHSLTFIPTHARGKDKIYTTWLNYKGYTHTYSWNKIYKKTLFQKLHFPIGKIFEDIYLMPQLLAQVQHYYYSNQGCYFYYKRENSITQKLKVSTVTQRLEHNILLFKHLNNSCPKPQQLLPFYLLILDNQVDNLCVGATYFEMPHYKPTLIQLFSANISPFTKIKNLLLPFVKVESLCEWRVILKKWLKRV